MQIKITMRHHLAPAGKATLKTRKQRALGRTQRLWSPCVLLVQPLWGAVWRFLKKLNIELPCNSAILLLGVDPNELKATSPRDVCDPCSQWWAWVWNSGLWFRRPDGSPGLWCLPLSRRVLVTPSIGTGTMSSPPPLCLELGHISVSQLCWKVVTIITPFYR